MILQRCGLGPRGIAPFEKRSGATSGVQPIIHSQQLDLQTINQISPRSAKVLFLIFSLDQVSMEFGVGLTRPHD